VTVVTVPSTKRNFRRLDEDFLIIYKTYVRPHLEYCIQVWSPHLATDVLCLEKIQRAATKIVPGLKKLEYGDQLKRLGLTTLESQRKRGDLIDTYKILTGKENIESNKFFELSDNARNLRGHSKKISVKRSRLNVRKFFFSQRVVPQWNSLPETVVIAPSMNTFKNRLDKALDRYGQLKLCFSAQSHQPTSTSTSNSTNPKHNAAKMDEDW